MNDTEVATLANELIRINASSGIIPVGTIFANAGSNVPPGWLPCNGAAISRSGVYCSF